MKEKVAANVPTNDLAGLESPELTVVAKLEPDGPGVEREPVREADLVDIQGEMWLNGCLRKGYPDSQMAEMPMRLSPIFKDGEGRRCAGFQLEARNPGGETTSSQFGIQSLGHVAGRASQRLLSTGALKPNEVYYYEVIAEQGGGAAGPRPMAESPGTASFTLKAKPQPLVYLTMSLPRLLERASAVGPVDGWCPVFYTVDAFAKAERFSRRGAMMDPPIESGGVLLGPICSCPETGEFFVVVNDALELAEAEQNSFSLEYSSETWGRILAAVRARQAHRANRADRIVGQCHGHNFLPPHDDQRCDECDQRLTCTQTSVFVSAQDLLWSRSVFARQPWAFCHIFGLNARAQEVHGIFGFRGGHLVQRGFHLIADFDPER